MAKDDKRIERLEKAVEKSEKKRRKLKQRVEALEEAVGDLQLPVDGQADESSEVSSEVSSEESGEHVTTGRPELSEPDESWTVARLREAATSRGLTGTSGMTKAELLDAVSEAGHRS